MVRSGCLRARIRQVLRLPVVSPSPTDLATCSTETEVYTASLTSTLALAFYLAERHHVEHASWPGTVPDEYYRHKANMFEGAKELMGWSTLGNNVDRDEDGKLYVAPLDEEEDESEETVEGMDDGEKEIKEERRTETIKAKMVQDSIDEV